MLQLDSGAEGWLHRTVSKNYWRVQGSFTDYDDLTQDGYLCWYTVADRYHEITDRGHMMRLFQITFWNHISWLSTRDKDKHFNRAKVTLSELVSSPNKDYSDAWILDNILSSQGICPLDLNQFIIESPEPARSVLRLLTSDQGPAVLRTPLRRYTNGRRQTLNQRLCRILSLDQGIDPLGKTKKHLVELV